jgi:hypothetical protein
MGIEINAVVDLAAALADEGQSQAIEKSDAAAQICGCLMTSEVASGCGG